jgi:transketolase
MMNPEAKLAENLLDKSKLEMVPTRMGFGKGLVEAGDKDKRVMALCCDLTESTQVHLFAQKYPDRYIEIGIAEQNMICVAAGLALQGKIPFVTSYATFGPGRNNEQIRTAVCISNLPVKIGGMHAGVSVGPDGMTHQALEDIALMRVLPRMIVIVPCDALESQKATLAATFNNQPTYLRFGREKTPVFTTADTPFEIGKALILREGKDVAIVGCGPLLYNSLLAAEELSKEGIECMVVNSHTVKPLDEKTIIEAAQKTGAVVSVEEHQITGGLGSAIAECLAKNYPVPQEFIGAQDRFGESGQPDELIEAMGMGIGSIKEAVKKAISRKAEVDN